MTSLVDAESVLTIDIGSVNTRALLFDVVDGQYHFLAGSVAPSTSGPPFFDIAEGVHIALTHLQEITNRPILDGENRVMVPSQQDGSGVDRLGITFSAGRDLNVVTVGLLGEVSLESASRLAASSYLKIVDSIGLNDRRTTDEQVDAILRAGPDLIILAGGTEKGASRSVSKLVDLVLLACKVLPSEKRPKVIYSGNQALAKRIQEVVGKVTEVIVTPNIRPTFDLEDLNPAMHTLAQIQATLRAQQLGGLANLSVSSNEPPLPNASAVGRLVRFLSEYYDPSKGVLGVDLGATSTVLAAGRAGKLHLNVMRPLGMGAGMATLLQRTPMDEILQWLPVDVPEAEVRDHLWQKSLYPTSLPMTTTTLAIEMAAARQILRLATAEMLERYPALNMAFEPIFISGATLAQGIAPVQSLLAVLDGLQPTGVTTLFLDPYGLMAALGTVASGNSVLPIQILDSGTFVNLASVISPVSDARPGTVILKVKVVSDQGNFTTEVKQGSIVTLPVRLGQQVQVFLNPQHGTFIDPRWRPNSGFKLAGGMCGVVIDARGRPLRLPEDAAKRRETILRWTQTVESRRSA
jgi:hypothetical protein